MAMVMAKVLIISRHGANALIANESARFINELKMVNRFAANVSEWPVQHKRKPLVDFLRFDPSPLSERAASGFLKRALASNLTLDDLFVAQLRKHVHAMKRRAVSRGR